MESILAVAVGVLYASGAYLVLRRTLGQLIIGLALLGNATNLLVFTAAGPTRDQAPLLADEITMTTDPVPQALILTAIVIGFGVLAFFMALAYRAYRTTGSDDLDELTETEAIEGGAGG